MCHVNDDRGSIAQRPDLDPKPDTGSARPPRLVALPHATRHRARRRVDPRRPRDHHRGQRLEHHQQQGRARPRIGIGGVLRRHDLPARRGRRCAVLRPPLGQARPTQPVHGHPRRVPDRRRDDRLHRRQGTGLGAVAGPQPVRRRHGYRWRVRRHQLRHRRAHPGEIPRPRRHRRQRHVLGRCIHRLDPHRRRREQPLGRGVLAGRLPDRTGSRLRDPVRPEEPSRESAMAAHARTQRGGRGGGQTDRGRSRRRRNARAG